MLRRSFQVPIAFLLLACGILLSATINHGTNGQSPAPAQHPALEVPSFSIVYRRGRLVLHSTTASAAHEQTLSNIIASEFDLRESSLDYWPGITHSGAWMPTTIQLLLAVAATESGSATIIGNAIRIRGVSANGPLIASRLEALREVLPAQFNIDADIVVIDNTTPFAALCARAYSRVLDLKIEFYESSAEIGTSSYAGLDKIIDVAHDCNSSAITITGHSDASGDETWNRRLSLARAQSVADYMTRAGIATERLVVAGSGSSQPIADNSTALGRSLNRRIEFALQSPLL